MNERISCLKQLLAGFYALYVYLPLSALSRRWRRVRLRIRGKQARFLQNTKLPAVSWRKCAVRRMVRICEAKKANGNIRVSELAILAILAAETEDFTDLFEIGTFDGRTTINLAMNASGHCRIYTLDLPPEVETRFALEPGERHMVDKPEPGLRYRKYKHSDAPLVGKIHQLLGDSAKFDCAELAGSCSLVFVDGSHAYDYAMSDTALAMHLVKEGGVIVWHDYGIWEGVTRALEFLEQRDQLALKNIRGTSLVYWKKPARQQRNVADRVVCATPKK